MHKTPLDYLNGFSLESPANVIDHCISILGRLRITPPPPPSSVPAPPPAPSKTKKTVKLFWCEVRRDDHGLVPGATVWDELDPVPIDTQKLEHLFESRAKDLITKVSQGRACIHTHTHTRDSTLCSCFTIFFCAGTGIVLLLRIYVFLMWKLEGCGRIWSMSSCTE